MKNCYNCRYLGRPTYIEPCTGCKVNSNWERKEGKEMDIKVNRKEMDKREKTLEAINKMLNSLKITKTSHEDIIKANALDEIEFINTGVVKGEVESIEIPFGYFNFDYVRHVITIPIERLAEINKAMER